MRVAVVDVGIVRMLVDEPRVRMDVHVRFLGQLAGAVRMLVVLVMHVGVFVRHGLMLVHVLVMLDQMQIKAQRHERRRKRELPRDWLSEDEDAERRAD